MEIPIQVAVRLKPPSAADSSQCIFSNATTQAVLTQSGQTFRVSRALSTECSQADVYMSIAPPQLACFLDGCDTSVVALGASGSGKTYTIFGPGFECIHSECDLGIIPRFITELFQKLSLMPEREFTIHMTWMQVVDNMQVYDVLGSGLVRCDNVEEAFQYLQLGWRSRCSGVSHNIFTVSMEQKWVGTKGEFNHRLSTASFCDLAAYPDPGLYTLENIIQTLLSGYNNRLINYEQSILTAMLRDSFGGRAFTWIMGCISTDPQDVQETFRTLNLCMCCLGIKNFVTVNAFSDNNTLIVDKFSATPSNCTDGNFSLQFAAGQWSKLISNAEGLFNKILQSKSLTEAEADQISKWLVLKAECDECTNGDLGEDKEALQKQGLPRIAEDTEPSDSSESDVESDCESNCSDTVFKDKLDKFMEYFREKNDELYADRCEEYLNHVDSDDITISVTSGSQSLPVMTSQSMSGRRRTVQPCESLSETELELLRKVAAKAISPESQKIIIESHKQDIDPEPKLIQRELLKMIDSPNDHCKKYKATQEKFVQKQSLARKLSKEIDSSKTQLKELIGLCIAKEHLIDELSRIIRNNSSNRVNNESLALKEEYQKAKNDLTLAQSKLLKDKTNSKILQTVNKCKTVVEQYEKRNRDLALVGSIDQDTTKEIRKHENKLKSYKKQIEQIKRQIKKDEKRRNTLDVEIAKDKIKLDELSERDSDTKDKKCNSLKHVTSRLTQLDSIIREKASDLQKSELTDQKEIMLRKEIKNLRKTRECLHEQRCSLGYKRKIYKSLSDSEERKILECEEAIEAIDTAIEYKNALICGRSPSASLSDGMEQDGTRGEKMLMARLDKLSHDEMKTLLYKYFQKVVDLRGACAAIECTATAAAEEAAEWRVRAAAAWRHAERSKQHHTQTRHYQAVHRVVNGGGAYERAVSLGITSDSDMSDDAVRLVDRMKQLARYQQPPVIPSQNLKQLMPAMSQPVAKVTKQRNKLVIIQEKKH